MRNPEDDRPDDPELRSLLRDWEIETARVELRDRILGAAGDRSAQRPAHRVTLSRPLAASIAAMLVLGGYWVGRASAPTPTTPSAVEIEDPPLVTPMKLAGLEPRIEVRVAQAPPKARP
jgi:hypothetical protein